MADAMLVAGCNDRVQLSQLGRELNRRIVGAHQLGGVTVVDPDTTYIDVNVDIAQDVTIEPGTHLRGATSIDEDAVIGPDTTLVDTHVSAGASVRRSEVRPRRDRRRAPSSGPFSYLRPGTDLGPDGKIGAFAETKNANDRGRQQGPAPELHRRCHDRRGHQHRLREWSPSITTA